MNWRSVAGIAVGAILVASYGLLKKRDDDVSTNLATPPQPGYYVKDATIIEIGSTGLPRYKLRASNITQNPDDNSIALDDVAVQYLGVADTTWLLDAQHGAIAADSRVITFNGAVNIQPQGTHIHLPMVLSTETLHIDTDHNLASAPGKVSIVMNQQRLTAVGMQADLQRQTVRLQSQVHGEFYAQ